MTGRLYFEFAMVAGGGLCIIGFAVLRIWRLERDLRRQGIPTRRWA